MSGGEKAGLQPRQCTGVELRPELSPHELGMGGKENIKPLKSPVGYLEWSSSEQNIKWW